ncbi:hypothetical protein [Nakamurella lactea]|uniref:hypothetical protein n=1 Tax=Nakamurella lactea TaxID=459515 RepID=UPI0003FCDD54|nr:hypothetical protein [Nakamurella lactea]
MEEQEFREQIATQITRIADAQIKIREFARQGSMPGVARQSEFIVRALYWAAEVVRDPAAVDVAVELPGRGWLWP